MLTLTDEQKCPLSIQPLTAAGNPARVDGVPVWASSDVNVISLDVASDGMSAVARTPGTLGTSTVSCIADADLGSGVREIVAVLDITVVAAEAATMGIATGTPEIE